MIHLCNVADVCMPCSPPYLSNDVPNYNQDVKHAICYCQHQYGNDAVYVRLQGDIAGNTFTGNTAPSGAAVFRTVSSGDVRDNKRLAATDVDIDNPASNR